jgi:hypothetical protein
LLKTAWQRSSSNSISGRQSQLPGVLQQSEKQQLLVCRHPLCTQNSSSREQHQQQPRLGHQQRQQLRRQLVRTGGSDAAVRGSPRVQQHQQLAPSAGVDLGAAQMVGATALLLLLLLVK